MFENAFQFIIGLFLILSSIGVVTLTNPVHAALSFLLTLLLLATLYVELSAEFIGVMQVLVYAGAILVIFMFVIILFQDAHQKIILIRPKTRKTLIYTSIACFLAAAGFALTRLTPFVFQKNALLEGYGSVESLGKALYIDFFFPFEAVIFLFLVAIVGALYIGKKDAFN